MLHVRALPVLLAAAIAGCGKAPPPLTAPAGTGRPAPAAVSVGVASTPPQPASSALPASSAPSPTPSAVAPTPAASTVPAAAAPVDMPAIQPAATPTAAPPPSAAPARPSAAPTASVPANGYAAGTRTLAPGSTSIRLAPGEQALVALAGGQAGGDAVLAGSHAADGGMRAWERRLDGRRPRPRYGLAAAPEARVGDTARFWVVLRQVDEELIDTEVEARLVRVGRHGLVWVDTTLGETLDARAVELGEAFDERIWPTDTRLFGEPVPGDRDPRVSILVSPAVGDGGREATIGYFTTRDLFTLADAPDVPDLARSNDRLLLYVSSLVVARGRKADWLGTLAHELQHLISATRKLFGPRRAGRQEALWLNEALSMYAMHANGLGLDGGGRVLADHVASYLQSPQDFPLVDWRRARDGSAYGAAYLFALYMAERVGDEVMTELVDSPEIGLANVEARLAARGLSMARLFRDWVAATALDGGDRPADPAHAYRAIDLHGTYAGVALAGPKATPLSLPGRLETPLPPWTARYVTIGSASGGSFELDLAGAPFGWLW